MAPRLFLQPDFDQGLIWHIAGIGRRLDGIQQVLGQSLRNCLRRGFEIGQGDAPGPGPVQSICRVVGLPIVPLGLFVCELRDGLQWVLGGLLIDRAFLPVHVAG